MKYALITGANKGIGFETARQLAQKGFHVFISGCDETKLSEALKNLEDETDSAEAVLMDVSKDESVSGAAKFFSSNKIKLDVLINNAGILLKEDRSLVESDAELLEMIINTNSYGPMRVIKTFIHVMNNPGRIINITSGGGSMFEPVGGWSPAYCVSKTLLNSFTRHLAYELKGNGISVNAVCPGWVRTDMGGRSAPRSVRQGAETQVWLASEAPQKLTGKIFRDKSEIEW